MRTPSLTVTEKQFQATVIAMAKTCGWMVYHTHDSRKSEPGFPDLTMTRNGRMVYAELKTQSGRTTPEQDAWLAALAECDGNEVFVWRPSDFQEITETLALARPATRLEVLTNG